MASLSQNGNVSEEKQNNVATRKYSHDGSVSSTSTGTPSETWYDDQDFVLHYDDKERMPPSDVSDNFPYSCALESHLKEKEIDLYNDLITLENEEKKTIENYETEIENLRKEVEKLRESESVKDTRISELSKENENLKKNICSLYKTAKSEIDHKDNLLAEANEKLDDLLRRKKIPNFRNDQCERCARYDAERKQPSVEAERDKKSYDDRRSSKRKRFEDSTTSSSHDKVYEPSGRSSKYSRNRETSYESYSSKRKESKSSHTANNYNKAYKSTERSSRYPRNIDSTPESHSSKRKESKTSPRLDGSSSNKSCAPTEKISKYSKNLETIPESCPSRKKEPETLRELTQRCVSSDKADVSYEKGTKLSKNLETTSQSHLSGIKDTETLQKDDSSKKPCESVKGSSSLLKDHETELHCGTSKITYAETLEKVDSPDKACESVQTSPKLPKNCEITTEQKIKDIKIPLNADGADKACESNEKNTELLRNHESISENHFSKGKDIETLQSTDSPCKELELVEKSSSLSRDLETTPQSKNKQNETLRRTYGSSLSLQTLDTIPECSLSRDSTETNNLFFNLLPEPLKLSFYEYERSQIISLNKLKQSFVNEYFNFEPSAPPSSVQSTPKRPKLQMKTLLFDKNFQSTSSVNTSLLTPSTNNRNEAHGNHSCRVSQLDEICSSTSAETGTSKTTRDMQMNVALLWKYKEKVPLFDKKKI